MRFPTQWGQSAGQRTKVSRARADAVREVVVTPVVTLVTASPRQCQRHTRQHQRAPLAPVPLDHGTARAMRRASPAPRAASCAAQRGELGYCRFNRGEHGTRRPREEAREVPSRDRQREGGRRVGRLGPCFLWGLAFRFHVMHAMGAMHETACVQILLGRPSPNTQSFRQVPWSYAC